MKRYHSGDSPGRWKRIIGPVEDSDSSSSDLDDCEFMKLVENLFRFSLYSYIIFFAGGHITRVYSS